MRLAVLALAIALLLPGCANDDPDASPSPTPGPGTGSGTTAPAVVNATPEAQVVSATYQGEWALGWSANGEENTAVGTSWPMHEATGNVTGVVVTMEWTATSPASDRLRLIVDHEDQDRAGVSGTSPLQIVFEGDAAVAGQYYMAAVAAQEPGAYVRQAVTFTVAVVTDGPFDAAAFQA